MKKYFGDFLDCTVQINGISTENGLRDTFWTYVEEREMK